MKKSITLAAFAVIGMVASSHAAISSSWTADGGAWLAANQPNFSAGSGVLYSDQSIAAGTNNSLDNTFSTLTVGGNVVPGPSGGIYPAGYYYSLFSSPTLTISTTTDSPLDVLSLTMFGNATTDAEFVTLTINGTTYAASTFSTPGGGGGFEENIPSTWTWDLSEAGIAAGSTVSLSFDLDNHNVVNGLSLSQVPEPSAALLGVLGATGFFIRRRR